MSFLKPGTLCVTVGGTGENAGRIVVILSYVGPYRFDPAIQEGYSIRTASGRPFESIKRHTLGGFDIVRNKLCECVADRSRLRPLVDPTVDAEEQTCTTPRTNDRDVEPALTTEV